MAESIFQRSSRTLNAAIDAVRESDTTRNRAVLALARHDAERIGYPWDALPWRDDDTGAVDQCHFVMHAMAAVDMLIAAGFIDAEIPAEAIEYREAAELYHVSMFKAAVPA
jgi:hypothetical protein